MADKVKQSEILQTISKKLHDEFNCTIYSDEALEGFAKPCFFIKFVTTTTPQTVNFVSKNMAVYLTYFPKDSMRQELHYLEIFERIENLFQIGIQLKERFLHIDTIDEDRVGEEADILQIKISISYLDKVIKPQINEEIMGELHAHVTIDEESEETIWQS